MFAKKTYSKAEAYALEDTKSKADLFSYWSFIGIPVGILDEFLKIPTEKMKKWPLQTLKIGLIFDHKNEIYIYFFFWKKIRFQLFSVFAQELDQSSVVSTYRI